MTAEPPAPALPQRAAAAARMLSQAAQAAASAWAQPMDPASHSRAVRQLYSTLRDLSIATRGLAGWPEAGDGPGSLPAAPGFRQRLAATSRALLVAVRNLDGVLAAEGLGPVQDGSEPGTALHQAARHAIPAWRQPAGAVPCREDTAEQLVTAIAALARAADSLAGSARQPRVAQLHAVRAVLGDVKSCLAGALHADLAMPLRPDAAPAQPDAREAE